MQALCDANLLLAVVYEPHIHHATALAWLDKRTKQEAVLCRMTQITLLRLLTTSTIMGVNVCTHERAWQIWNAIMDDARFLFRAEPNTVDAFLRLYTRAGVPSPKLWQDAYLAAFSRSAGIHMTTFDRGFQRFANLQLELLV